jgi:hypothetical protein
VVRAIDLLNDVIAIGGPEGEFTILLAEVLVDRRLRFDERMEDTTLQSPARGGGEKAFDCVGPGA